MGRFLSLLLALHGLMAAGLAGPLAHGQDAPIEPASTVERTAPAVIAPAPAEDGTVMFVFVTVEGERVELRQRRTADGKDEYDAKAIFNVLRGEVSTDGTVLSVRRFQDGATLSIDMVDGKVSANEQELGLLPNWIARETADTWLDANAIAILTGTIVGENDDKTLSFTLDDRLRPQFDLELWVEGERIPVPEIEPRTIGPVLLIPLAPIVDALGHDLEVDADGIITVTRLQDTARIALDPTTGVVAVNDQIVGISPNMNYAEPNILLFPSSAVETLTGTHIKLAPGTDEVRVTLDDRLGGGALPDAYVLDQAKATPFTLERLNYEVSTQGPATVSAFAHRGTLNGRGTIRTAGGLQDPAALIPSQMTIDLVSLSGWRASLGDVTPGYRELSGADTGRVRGGSWQTRTEDGDIISVTAGLPVSGSNRLSERASVPTFGGLAAGARLIRPDKMEEVGVSMVTDGEAGRFVVSAQKDLDTGIRREKAGLQSANANLDVGAFQGASPSAVDLRGQASGSYRLSERMRVRARTSYEGASFLTRARQDDDGTITNVQGSRTNALVSLDWRARKDWSIVKGFGMAARANTTRQGERAVNSVSLSAAGRVLSNGPSVSVDVSQASVSGTDDAANSGGYATNLRLFQRFKWGDAQLAFQSDGSENGGMRMVGTVNGLPITRALAKDATVSVSPSATFLSANGQTGGRLGASVFADSGAAFGERFRLGGQMSVAQSFDSRSSGPNVFANLSGSYYLNRYIQLSGTFGQSLSGGGTAMLTLRGSAPFNPPRKHSLPKEGSGVLQGRAFLDRNRDGIRQSDEPGIPGIIISIDGTPLQLGADYDGFYTIQNMRAGLYSMRIDKRTLPLGLLVPDSTSLRVTVADGRITTANIPVIASGQIRGTVFIDADGSGDPNSGDTRLDGAVLTLTNLDAPNEPPEKKYAASFGQYAFENLKPGRYRLEADVAGRTADAIVTLSETDLLQVQNIAFDPGMDPASKPGDNATVVAVAP